MCSSPFLNQACEHLKIFIDDCDRRTDLAKKRLLETQEELSAEVNSKAEKVGAQSICAIIFE